MPRDVAEGDLLIGLTSDGVHSNGYSLVRRIVEQSGLAWDDPAPFRGCLVGRCASGADTALCRPALAAIRAGGVHGLAHITGGGLTENLPRALPEGLGARGRSVEAGNCRRYLTGWRGKADWLKPNF